MLNVQGVYILDRPIFQAAIWFRALALVRTADITVRDKVREMWVKVISGSMGVVGLPLLQNR